MCVKINENISKNLSSEVFKKKLTRKKPIKTQGDQIITDSNHKSCIGRLKC